MFRNKIYWKDGIRIAVGLTIMAILLLAGSASAVPVEEWNKTFGGTYDDEAYAVQQTSDGGYIFVGYTMYKPGIDDALLIKTDANGNELWSKTFGGASSEQAKSVQQTLDGGYILAGSTSSYGAGSVDAWLIKTDASGNQYWSKTFGGIGADAAYSVQQTSDGGYILAGGTSSFGDGGLDAYVIKTDSNGNQLWSKTFGGTKEDHVESVQQTLDGGYILAGGTWSYSVDNVNLLWLIKIDANGNKQWNKTFDGSVITGWAYSVQQTSDSGYILLGTTNAGGLLIKTDANGNAQWNKTSLGDGYTVYSVQQTQDAGYILAGYMWAAGKVDASIIKTDANGNEQWNKTFGGTSYDEVRSAYQTSDGGYILAGHTKSYGAGDRDAWLIKVGAEPAEPTKTPTASPTEKAETTKIPAVSPTEKAEGFEVILAITALSSVYMFMIKRS